jgi:hypothetical protein
VWRKVNLREARYVEIEALARVERRSVATMVDLLLERALGSNVTLAASNVTPSVTFQGSNVTREGES